MSIINKYITNELIKYFSLLLATVIGIFLIVDLFGKFGKIIEVDLSLSTTLSYFLLKIPQTISQFAPVGMILAVITAIGIMNKNNEIVALRSGGVSTYFLLKPVIFLSLGLGLFVFILSDFLVPATVSKANRIWLENVRKDFALILKERNRNVWAKGNRSIFHIQYYYHHNSTISGITLYYFGKDFVLNRRIDATEGRFENGKWILYNIIEQKLDRTENIYNITFHEKQIEEFGFVPDDLKGIAKKSEEMSLMELSEYIKEIEAEEYNATSYRVDFHAKIALPFACAIMCMAAAGIAVRRKMKEKFFLSILYGIGMIFLFNSFYNFCLSLGKGGVLPPIIAAWTANFVLLCLAGYLLIRSEY